MAPRLAYLADEDIDNAVELYLVNGDGSARAKLSEPAQNARQDVFPPIAWSPDGTRLAYRADVDGSDSNDPVVELFTVPADGGPAVRVSGPMVPRGDVSLFGWE